MLANSDFVLASCAQYRVLQYAPLSSMLKILSDPVIKQLAVLPK